MLETEGDRRWRKCADWPPECTQFCGWVSAWVISLYHGVIPFPAEYSVLRANTCLVEQSSSFARGVKASGGIMRILIAMDGSTASEVSIQEAVSRPWPTGSRFYLITAVDPFFFVPGQGLLAEAQKTTEEHLEENARKLRNAGWETSTSLVLESP